MCINTMNIPVIVYPFLASVIFINEKNRLVRLLCIVIVICYTIKSFLNCKSYTFQLNRICNDGINEVLLLEANLNNLPCLFMLDTGYAGPPVISRSYLSIKDNWISDNVADRYKKLHSQFAGVSEDEEHHALSSFLANNSCLPYTSGCTMRLMGIGTTQEQQADMLMCPMLKFKNIKGSFVAPKKNTQTFADVFVTNSLRSSVHILTCDFILHHSPCLLRIEKEKLELSIPLEKYYMLYPQFFTLPAIYSGGSFVISFFLDDEKIDCTMDTGAPGPISIGAKSANKLKSCQAKTRKRVTQKGVNGESICSDIVETDVKFGGSKYTVPMFINTMQTEFVDGYVGMGFLRAFDILITNTEVGFRKNNLEIRSIEFYENLASNGVCSNDIECLK